MHSAVDMNLSVANWPTKAISGCDVFLHECTQWVVRAIAKRSTRGAFLSVGGFNEAYYCAEEVVLSREFGREGRFVVLQEAVITSAGKVRAYSTRELLTSMFHIAIHGRTGMQRREGLDIWYGDRRSDRPGK